MKWLCSVMVPVLMVGASAMAVAQDVATTGSVQGVVTDATGGVIVGAPVDIANTASTFKQSTVTDATGRYAFNSLAFNAYRVTITAPGFKPQTKDAPVRTTAAVDVSFTLELSGAAAQESIQGGGNTPVPLRPGPTRAPQLPSALVVPAGPTVNLWYGGLVTGRASVLKSGGIIGAEAGGRAWRSLDGLMEVGSVGDVVQQPQLDVAAPLTAYLQKNYGKTATSTVKRPAVFFTIGARWVFEDLNLPMGIRPYGQFGVGVARVERKPTFTLGGTDITSTLPLYGVTLGADMTDTERRGAVTGGFGVLIPYRMLYGDIGYRVTSIKTAGSTTNVNRLHIGVGVRF